MKEYKLTRKDLSHIKNIAQNKWVDESIKDDYFVVECYMKAILMFMNLHNLQAIDGTLYESSDSKSK